MTDDFVRNIIPVSRSPNERVNLIRNSYTRIGRGLIYLVLVIALLWTVFPFWSALTLSVKHRGDFFTPKFFPFIQFRPTLDNWRAEFREFGSPSGLGRGLVNSLVVALLSSGVSLALGGLTAFGLKLMGRRRRLLFSLMILLLLPRFVPPAITVIPFLIMMKWFGLTDTLAALIIAHSGLSMPLAVLVLHSALRELPDECLDAAQVDGCGMFGAFRSIAVPLLLPALLAAGALCFAQSWNEFLYALINMKLRARTAPLSIASLITKDGIEFEYVGSHLLLVLLPPPLLALLARRYIVRGLSLGAISDENRR
jgi:multiple sugar transport system permease protein